MKTIEKKDLTKVNALDSLSGHLQIDPAELKKVLKATVFNQIKQANGSYRDATDEEFMAFIVVCNTYKLNPLTKEIYAYPDTKGKKIVPVVSTDGWNRLMTEHKNYKNHSYTWSEEMVELSNGKKCPEWCEISIEKGNGTVFKIREFIGEVYRELDYNNPWKTHPTRMLRHKTKIQGAREAFGFSGIYDKDEAERIHESVAASSEALAIEDQSEMPSETESQYSPEEQERKNKVEAVAHPKFGGDKNKFNNWLADGFKIDDAAYLDDKQVKEVIEALNKLVVEEKTSNEENQDN